MMHKKKFLIAAAGIFFFMSGISRAIEVRQEGTKKIIIPDRVSERMTIDGELNEKVWSNPAIRKNFKTYMPVYGDDLSQETEVWAAYDSENLYFAFKCYETDPKKIKTSVCQRDKMFHDDWVGVELDSMANKQSCYEFYVNPSGIQGDVLNSAATGIDKAPDYVWESSAKITDDGYRVEMRIPLDSIRYKSGKEVRMGIIFLRNISRLGTGGIWPETHPGQTEFNFMATIIYKNLESGLKLEVLPNFTYSRDEERESVDEWDKDTSKNLGVSVKYGITTSITAEATVKPDFSQVESDAFQVEVNRRYPVFYSEKRPFFMEGVDVFDFGVINQGMMVAAVHTRHIVDPGWAAKLSGTAGKTSFTVLAANDQAPGTAWEEGVNPGEGKDAFWGIFGAKYNLGSDNSLGVLYSGRHFAGSKNNVAGADLQYRFFKNLRLSLSYLHSMTEREAESSRNGNGFNAMLQYLIPKLTVWAAYERYDGNFVMESAFLNRTDISRGLFYFGPNFYTKIKGMTWLRRIQPYLKFSRLHDLGSGMDDTSWGLGVDMHFTLWGFLNVEYHHEKEAWQGQLFNPEYFSAFGDIQLFKWLTLQADYSCGNRIYYHPEEPALGTGYQAGFGFTLQANVNLNLNFEWVHSVLHEKTADETFYSVDIFNIRTTYQFNKYFFLRGAVRYDSYQDKVLTDFLASFTLIPGTVMHLGYGSLYERKEWLDNRWLPGTGPLQNMRNGLFFKVSYLWQIK